MQQPVDHRDKDERPFSAADLFITPGKMGGQGDAELAREMMVFPTDAAEFLGRTEFSIESIKRKIRIFANNMMMDDWDIDSFQLLWLESNMMVSHDRRGRLEALQAITQRPRPPIPFPGAPLGDMVDRGRGLPKGD